MDERHQARWAERVLVQRLAAGDETALVDLYDRYAAFVYGLAVRTLVDRQVAQDITQEVFVSLWEHPERIDSGRGTLRGFLGTLHPSPCGRRGPPEGGAPASRGAGGTAAGRRARRGPWRPPVSPPSPASNPRAARAARFFAIPVE
jgi:hypothetical protein